LDSAALGAAGADHLVVCTGDGTYFAVGAATGEEAWTVERNASSATAPAVEDGVVYMGGKALTAVDLTSGDEIWSLASESLSSQADNWGPPTVDGSRLIAVDDGGGRVVDKVGGEVISRFWLDGTEPPRTPAVVQGNTYWVVEGGTSSGVSAFGKPSSEHRDMLVWTYESASDDAGSDDSGSEGPGSEGPWYVAAAGNRVFLLNSGSLVALPVF
jgi:outer membrane protein assembly factor BamB